MFICLMELKIERFGVMNIKAFAYIIFFFFCCCCCSVFVLFSLGTRFPLFGKSGFHFQECYDKQSGRKIDEYKTEDATPSSGMDPTSTRKLLVGPGSFPPRCSSKCGRCKPCKPVHVTVPPGTPVTAEYYPVAWRCKCHDKLYLP